MPEPSHRGDPARDARAEFEATGVESAAHARPGGEGPGDLIDRYRLIEPIGEGGMGTVWEAQQSDPVRRRVALKIIKLGMDTREVVVRFEVERQALALMDHPYIAKVLDGGATRSGRPYFVMELVAGTPITDYCDATQLGLRERLELFTRVCQAIQHAHQKGIIHRDIKPSNVLVAEHDGVPSPRVIDFGIAKATDAELTQKTLFTQHAQIIGTPEYMAPEQAERGGLDIDTRADVYALGALLYEMLTGTKLFELEDVLGAGYAELLRTIREVDPERPSTRISTLGERATPIAARRHASAAALRKRITGDLDWIVMKALEKERERRYDTASDFAADVQRFLDHEAVAAAPPSASYRLRKFVRRRRKTVAVLATIALLVVAGSVGTGVSWWNARQANAALSRALDERSAALRQEERQRTLAQQNEGRALGAESEARAEAERASVAEREAERRSAELQQVTDFQAEQLNRVDAQLMGVRMRGALLAAAPAGGRAALDDELGGVNFTTLALRTLERDLFEGTLDAIGSTFPDQPLVCAQLLQTMASTLRRLGLLEQAAVPQMRALTIRRAELGDEHPDTLRSMNGLARLLLDQGKLAQAESAYTEALETGRRVLGDEHPGCLTSIAGLGIVFRFQGRLAEAEARYRQALEARRRVLGDEHRDTLESISNMGYLLWSQQRFPEAEPFLREALEGKRRVLGDEHTDTLLAIGAMGSLLQEQGRLSQAEPYYLEALEARRRVHGDDHPETLATIGNLSTLLQDQGRLAEAEVFAREALEGRRRVLGRDHRATQYSLGNLGVLLQDQGRLAEAEVYTREALESRRRLLGNEHLETLNSINNMAFLLYSQRKLPEAARYYREAVDLARRLLGDANPNTQLAVNSFTGLLRDRVRAARAAGDEVELGDALADLGALRLTVGDAAQAEPVLAEAFDLLSGALPETDPRPWMVMSDLGAAIAAQGRVGEAEAVLLESATVLMEVLATPGAWVDEESYTSAYVDARSPEGVVQRVVEFYDARSAAEPGGGHDAGAREWRERLRDWRSADE